MKVIKFCIRIIFQFFMSFYYFFWISSLVQDKDLPHFLRSKNRTELFQARQGLYYLYYLSNTQRRKISVLTPRMPSNRWTERSVPPLRNARCSRRMTQCERLFNWQSSRHRKNGVCRSRTVGWRWAALLIEFGDRLSDQFWRGGSDTELFTGSQHPSLRSSH